MTPRKFRILLHKEVIQEDSRHFNSRTKDKIKKKCLEVLSYHPEKAGEALHGELAGYRRLKIFDAYRIVYRVNSNESAVFILAVGIRRREEVYKEAIKRIS